MARTALLFCFAVLITSTTLLDAFSPSLPAMKVPETVKDIEPYTTEVVKKFLADLENKCPKTQEFKVFFEKLKTSAKYVFPITKALGTEDSNVKASDISQAFSAFSRGEYGSEKSVVKKGDGSTKLTKEQQIAIKGAILQWEKSATRDVKILVRRSISPRNPRDG
ncbi:PREDICTED: uncharacterized protein LOC104823936 isoform X3 [Tarenaya hassleriana]|uniref:uncharacterized protein LOC104823936 isoform X3 n=1 Tax=Tarenaya hassleriana TaxID=28532 RepID=UPI00053C72C8|nr:PREDICTED: uncharacterized protein LOC104823936 isoform X3 [Tarenaya hassleriana]